MTYQVVAPEEPLSQGDIFDACPLDRIADGEGQADLDADPLRWTASVIVLTQACDLAQAKTTKVLVAMLQPIQRLVDKGVLKASVVRDQVRRGLVYGWYFLPTAPAPINLPESIVDLRELHTVPRAILQRLIADGKRIARVVTPFREHLAQHFAVTYMRIGLPEPPVTQP
jgi:hypothetical protein